MHGYGSTTECFTQPLKNVIPTRNLSRSLSPFGLAVKHYAIGRLVRLDDTGLISRLGSISPFSSKAVLCGHYLATLSLAVNAR